jgi:hypothetical protein
LWSAGQSTEAGKFWPIYKHYADDLHEVHNAKYALLKQYAEMWSTGQDALIYVRRSMEVDAEAQALRLKYVPVVTQVLPGKKAATFFQLERKLCMMVDLQLFSQIPLACEGGGGKRYQTSVIRYQEAKKKSLPPIPGDVRRGNNPNARR